MLYFPPSIYACLNKSFQLLILHKELSIAISLLIIFGMTFTHDGTTENAFNTERAYALGSHAGISIVYFPLQHKVYSILCVNIIITIGLIFEERYVYQYVVIPSFFLFFCILFFFKYKK